jgi:hypothetical protein
MNNNLVRTAIVTLMILALLIAMVIRHNRQRTHTPPSRSSVPISSDGRSG